MNTPTQSSDTILSQILIIVQEINVSISHFEEQITSVENSVKNLNKRIDDVISDGFPKGDLQEHKTWHENRGMPRWKRIILNLLIK